MINICSITGEILLSVPVLSAAVSHEELMTSDYIQLEWESDNYAVIPAGAYIEHNGEKYSLLEPYYPIRKNDVVAKYTPQFQSRVMRWQKAFVPVYTYEDDGETVKTRELDWTFTGTPSDAMYMVQQAIRHETGEEWKYEIAEGLPETITLSAQSATIWAILSEIAELCETEWWTKKTANYLYLSKCLQGVSVTLEVGRNVKVPTVSQNVEEGYCTRFYAFGSTRNVTQSEGVVQGSIVKKRLSLDPKKYPMGFKDIKGHFEDGVFVSDLKDEEIFPTSLYFEDVYPSSSLQIADVRKRMRYYLDDDGNKIRIGGTDENPIYDQYAIWYFQIPGFTFSEELIIKNQTLSVAFKSGKLRGREFELAYHPESKKAADKADVDVDFSVIAGEYEIMMDDSIEGFIIPDDDYMIPEEGDNVTLFNIEMPLEYTDSAMVELEEKLDNEIAERLKDNKSYEFSSNPVAFYEEDTDVELGQPVKFINGEDVLETRALMVEKHLDYNFEQKIRVGNEIIRSSRQQLRDDVKNIGEDVTRLRELEHSSSIVRRDHSRELRQAIGRYYAMQDSLELLKGAVEGFGEGINPLTIHTMAALVGDESLQFRFTKDRETLEPLSTCPLVYDPVAKQLNAEQCALIHMTLGLPREISTSYPISAYKSWDMEAWHGDILEDGKKAYYVYAKVEKEGSWGTYELTESPMSMETIEYYYFLVGILNAEYSDTRELVTFYGFTEILPGQISTDLIRSADGRTYFDLANGKIAGAIEFGAGSTGLENIEGFSETLTSALAGVKVGGQNMLRNSGFTGDYLSEQLADDSVLDATSQMYNSPFVHWDVDSAETVDCADAVSGKAVHLMDDGRISQELYQNIVIGEHYVLSFKAKGEGIRYSIGGVSDEVLSPMDEWKKHTISIVPISDDKEFSISSPECYICDLQFERGTIPTAWSNNPLDNNSDRAYYEALKYLDNVFNAVTDATTTVGGGLILTNQIHVGNYVDRVMKKATGGISGTWNKDDDPFLWGGGDISEANKAIETDGEEGANFVITHGGKAILNEAAVRGTIKAKAGSISGMQISERGLEAVDEYGEQILLVSPDATLINGKMQYYGRLLRKPIFSGSEDAINTNSAFRMSLNQGVADTDILDEQTMLNLDGSSVFDGKYAIGVLHGMFAGLRPKCAVVGHGETYRCSALDHTLISFSEAGIANRIYLPENPQDGQVIKIWKTNAHTLIINTLDGKHIVRMGVADSIEHGIDGTFFGTIDLIYHSKVGAWLMIIHYTS